MSSEAAKTLLATMASFSEKLDKVSSTTDQSVTVTHQRPISDETKRRVAVMMGRQQPTEDTPKRHDDAPTTRQRPVGDKSKPSRTGRAWTEQDYRLRGMRTPNERANDPKRVRLNTQVLESTQAALHTLAIELGVTLGEALDHLLGAT